MTSQARKANEDHGCGHAMASDCILEFSTQKEHQRKNKRQGEGKFVISFDKTARWSPNPARPPCGNSPYSPFYAVDTHREDNDPNQPGDLLSSGKHDHGHQEHQMDFEYFFPSIEG